MEGKCSLQEWSEAWAPWSWPSVELLHSGVHTAEPESSLQAVEGQAGEGALSLRQGEGREV